MAGEIVVGEIAGSYHVSTISTEQRGYQVVEGMV
jgi:hypothetical protein